MGGYIKHNCTVCGSSFMGGHGAKFCSESCKHDFRHVEFNCEFCGELTEGHIQNKNKYCSSDCATQAIADKGFERHEYPQVRRVVTIAVVITFIATAVIAPKRVDFATTGPRQKLATSVGRYTGPVINDFALKLATGNISERSTQTRASVPSQSGKTYAPRPPRC